jgi:hypothetical protein
MRGNTELIRIAFYIIYSIISLDLNVFYYYIFVANLTDKCYYSIGFNFSKGEINETGC